MPTQEPLNFEQPKNKLTEIAEMERAKLFPKNDYKKTAFEYSATNPDALSDGDDLGRGTGAFLDVYNVNAGTINDVVERKSEIKINQYNSSKTYPNF